MTCCSIYIRRLAACGLLLWALPSMPTLAQPVADNGPPPVANVRPDEQRGNQPITVQLFDRPLALRLGYEWSIERRKNFDLNSARDRDRRTRDQELKAEAQLRVSPRLLVTAQAVAVSEVRRQKATGTLTRDEGLKRGELWALFDQLAGTPLSLQVGRIPLVDARTWWWDDDLDAVRLMARGSNWYAETGIGRELARAASYEPGIDLAHRGVRRWFGQTRWTWAPRQSLEGFWLRAVDRSGVPAAGSLWSADDADGRDARLTWLGLRSSGNGRRAGGARWGYWADAGWVRGRETLTAFSTSGNQQLAGNSQARKVRGRGLDVGAQWTFTDFWRPTLTLGWAAGSGAVPGASVDGNFRQTGLQENKARLSGMKRLQRYGELFDPELSNLRVATAAFAVRPWADSSVELVWHRYRQAVASPVLADSRLSQAPQGLQTALGQEFDLLLAWRPTPQVELTLLFARFLPGDAFVANRRDPATSVELGLDLKF